MSCSMSSAYVRTQIKTYLTAQAPTETQIDFSAEYRTMEDIRTDFSLGLGDPFLGLQFIPSGEVPMGIPSNNAGGCFRETGVFFMHIVEPVTAQPTLTNAILTRADTLLGLFRGATINGDIYIESVTQANFDAGATLQFENGYEAASVTINFYRNNNF